MEYTSRAASKTHDEEPVQITDSRYWMPVPAVRESDDSLVGLVQHPQRLSDDRRKNRLRRVVDCGLIHSRRQPGAQASGQRGR